MTHTQRQNYREPSETDSSHLGRLTREQVVDRIMTLNPTAKPDFLRGFQRGSLSDYLARLDTARSPRGSGWVRRGNSPAIVTRRPGT